MIIKTYDPERIGIAPAWAFARIEKLEALIDAAYPFVAGHDWTNCDCMRCNWIRAANNLMYKAEQDHQPPSPHIDSTLSQQRTNQEIDDEDYEYRMGHSKPSKGE